jgi:hypothetical protein
MNRAVYDVYKQKLDGTRIPKALKTTGPTHPYPSFYPAPVPSSGGLSKIFKRLSWMH